MAATDGARVGGEVELRAVPAHRQAELPGVFERWSGTRPSRSSHAIPPRCTSALTNASDLTDGTVVRYAERFDYDKLHKVPSRIRV